LRILIFHGYLLAGTGSNVYNARLTQALVDLGHEVHLVCQERHPERCSFVGAAGDWDGGELSIRSLGHDDADSGGSCTIYRPDIGGLLPVYVQDRYEGLRACRFADCSDAEVAVYVQANVDAVREVAERVRPDAALANHLVMGPVILARALSGLAPYAVKVHGSALEYTVKPEPERFLGYASEGLAEAKTVLVGSNHTAQSLWRAMGDPELPGRTRLGPPGVDVGTFRPREGAAAAQGLAELIGRLRSGHTRAADTEGAFSRDERTVADALERVRSGEGELVAFVGKLIAAKGVDLLLEAWPLILGERPQTRLVVIGFGAERERFEAAAAQFGDQVIFTGRLDHEELADVLPLCEALVVPSTFPEAFGMVAIEAAACGVLPISAEHSGLAEVSEVLAEAMPQQARELLSFAIDEQTPSAIAARVIGWLGADRRLREQTCEALVSVVRERWSWEGVARGVIAAAQGASESPLARAVG
jgi:glycosyltransferase involved in cell wall biosynthesis